MLWYVRLSTESVLMGSSALSHSVANAGIAQVKGLLDLTEEEFQHMFAVNVFGVQNCYQAGAKQLIKQGNCTPEAPGKLIGVSLSEWPASSNFSHLYSASHC